MENILRRWRVNIKVWNREHTLRGTVYECTLWYDIEEPDAHKALEEVMIGFKEDCYYGEATIEKVWHTNRTRTILT